jgi:TolA-binding protein
MGLRIKKKPVAAAIEALAHSNVIRGVEIFATGTHNGREFGEGDIDAMLDAYHELKEKDFIPALKVGHTKDKVGGPAYGWVTNLTKKVTEHGVKLLADFESMHDSVLQAIRDRQYDRVSSEIYMDFKRGGKVFKRALKAVALLGAEVPAVAGLVPLHKIKFAAEGVQVFTSEAEVNVPDAAFMEALEARIAGIETFIDKEKQKMKLKSRTKRIAELSTELDTFKADMAKLRKKGKKDDDDEVKELNDKISALETKIAELKDEGADDETEQRLARLEAENASLRAEGRKVKVEKRVARCKIPAFRPQLAALFAHALENADTKVVVLSVDDKGKEKEEELTLTAVVEGLVDQINDKAEKLFKPLASVDHSDRQDDNTDEDTPASVELDEKAEALRDEKPTVYKTYSAAMQHVLKTDPDLRRRYDAEMAKGNSAKQNKRLSVQ